MTPFTKLQISRLWSAGLAVVLGGALALGSCKKNDSAATVPAPTPNVQLATSPTLGTFLADSAGNSVYFFALDVAGTNTCTSATCNPMWPVYYGGSTIRVPAGLDAKDFTTKKTADGRSQTFYKGWPLYYFAPPVAGVNTREAANQTTGNGVGGVWHVMNPTYSVVLGRTGVQDKTTQVVTTKTYLVDAQGHTLYYFAKDDTFPNTQPTNCAGGCASVWPALYLGASPTVPSTLKASDFGTISRDASTATGPYGTTTSTTQQLTYKGHPLYYYAADNATRGQVQGDHLSSFGDFWFVAAP